MCVSVRACCQMVVGKNDMPIFTTAIKVYPDYCAKVESSLTEHNHCLKVIKQDIKKLYWLVYFYSTPCTDLLMLNYEVKHSAMFLF